MLHPLTNTVCTIFLISRHASTLVRAGRVGAHRVTARTYVGSRTLVLIDVALGAAPALLAHASYHTVTPLGSHSTVTRVSAVVAIVERVTDWNEDFPSFETYVFHSRILEFYIRIHNYNFLWFCIMDNRPTGPVFQFLMNQFRMQIKTQKKILLLCRI